MLLWLSKFFIDLKILHSKSRITVLWPKITILHHRNCMQVIPWMNTASNFLIYANYASTYGGTVSHTCLSYDIFKFHLTELTCTVGTHWDFDNISILNINIYVFRLVQTDQVIKNNSDCWDWHCDWLSRKQILKTDKNWHPLKHRFCIILNF